MSARNVLVLSCSASKVAQSGAAAPAGKVYDGPAWRTLRAWQRAHPIYAVTRLEVYALSARYGLIDALTLIDPTYDQKMDAERAAELAGDVDQVAAGRRAFGEGEIDCLMFGSELYAGVLDALVPADLEYRRAGEGTGRGIGDMLGELKAWLNAVAA